MGEARTVLCGANAYDKKYYFNRQFDRLPQSVQDELHVICVLFTEEAGGIFTIGFEEDGSVTLQTEAAEEDYLYDEIGSGLLVGEIRRKRVELFESLSLYYRALILHEDVTALLQEDEGGVQEPDARKEKTPGTAAGAKSGSAKKARGKKSGEDGK